MDKEIRIITNNQWRNLEYGYELSAEEREEFDYIEDIDAHDFLRYRGIVYDIGEFMSTQGMPEFSPLVAWHGYHSDSFFSGVLVRFSEDCEQVQVATFIA